MGNKSTQKVKEKEEPRVTRFGAEPTVQQGHSPRGDGRRRQRHSPAVWFVLGTVLGIVGRSPRLVS